MNNFANYRMSREGTGRQPFLAAADHFDIFSLAGKDWTVKQT